MDYSTVPWTAAALGSSPPLLDDRFDHEERLELLLDRGLLDLGGDADLLDQKGLGHVEHLPLTEGELLAHLDHRQIPEDLSDLGGAPALDLLEVPAVATVPGLLDIAPVAPTRHELEESPGLRRGDDLAQPDRADLVHRDHDPLLRVNDPEGVEERLERADPARLDPDDLRDPLGRVNRQVPDLELDIGHVHSSKIIARSVYRRNRDPIK